MSQSKQVIELAHRWGSFLVAIITLFFAGLTFFDGSFVAKDFQGLRGCNGFLINDPPAEMLIATTLSEKEQSYLEDKINCYRDQIQKQPKDALTYTNIGEAERRLGNLVGARKAHQKALELKPDLQEAKIGLALVEQEMGNKVAANKMIQGALDQNPNETAYLYQGAILHKQNNLMGAAAAWRIANELDPSVRKFIKTWQSFNIKIN